MDQGIFDRSDIIGGPIQPVFENLLVMFTQMGRTACDKGLMPSKTIGRLRDRSGSAGAIINLSNGAQLCGVNPGSNTCNGKPEQLIILSAAPRPSGVRSCTMSPTNSQYMLAFDGNSLPHATVHMIPGFVKTGASNTKKTSYPKKSETPKPVVAAAPVESEEPKEDDED